jgi:hypothetical protein
MLFQRNIELLHQVDLYFVARAPSLEHFMYMWHVLLVVGHSLLHFVDEKSLLQIS